MSSVVKDASLRMVRITKLSLKAYYLASNHHHHNYENQVPCLIDHLMTGCQDSVKCNFFSFTLLLGPSSGTHFTMSLSVHLQTL